MTQVKPQNFNLHQVLVCPLCQGNLDFSVHIIKCTSCQAHFPQFTNDYLDSSFYNLMPEKVLENREINWKERLLEMESWYNELMTKPQSANDCFLADYTPYIPLLKTMAGDILDLGGGMGLPQSYLPPSTRYIVLDPSVEWLKIDKSSLIDRFPALKQKTNFVRGVGEYLPFPSESFDVVLSFWSLNHASSPDLVFQEVARVLRSGGRFLLILEESIPKISDILNFKFPAYEVFNSFFNLDRKNFKFPRSRLLWKLLTKTEFPLQSDHIRIQESDLKVWITNRFTIVRRVWMNQYLTFEFKKDKVILNPSSCKTF